MGLIFYVSASLTLKIYEAGRTWLSKDYSCFTKVRLLWKRMEFVSF